MHTIKKLKRSIVFILKLALFAALFGIFFGIFGIHNPWLWNLSRTTGVTMVTFIVLGIALMSVYGGYNKTCHLASKMLTQKAMMNLWLKQQKNDK